MHLAKDARKRVTIALWFFGVSLYLWFFALTIRSELDLMQYFNFCILLYGGGIAYHVTTELLSCPYKKSNKKQWGQIQSILFQMYFGYLISGASLPDGGAIDFLILFFGLFGGMMWVTYFLSKLHEPIRVLLNTADK